MPPRIPYELCCSRPQIYILIHILSSPLIKSAISLTFWLPSVAARNHIMLDIILNNVRRDKVAQPPGYYRVGVHIPIHKYAKLLLLHITEMFTVRLPWSYLRIIKMLIIRSLHTINLDFEIVFNIESSYIYYIDHPRKSGTLFDF